jgi:aromatic ring-opening dioxygenase LigB subunit
MQEIDDTILSNYKLWLTNFIAYDIVQKNRTIRPLYFLKRKIIVCLTPIRNA